jgi:hypothetical protein
MTAMIYQASWRLLAWLAVTVGVGCWSASSLAAPPTTQNVVPKFWSYAATPAMGWNSYDCWGTSVTEEQVLANARYMKERLLAHGWKYIVIDARWYDSVSPDDDRDFTRERSGAKLFADGFGRLLPAPNRFPSAADGKGFKPLADQLHEMGLRFGIHLMRGIPRQAANAKTPIADSSFTAADAANIKSTCNWCPDMFGVKDNDAGQAWYDAMFRLYASWGVDFVKVDDLSKPYSTREIEMIRMAIDRSGRAIVFSTSPGPTDVAKADHISRQVNQWRISGDFWDRWKDLDHQFDLLAQWTDACGPGHFPDADMIPFGHIGIRCTIAGRDRRTRFTRDEQMALMSLWSLASSPLILGMHLPDNDEFTESLLTNDEVLAINQDPLCGGARRITAAKGLEVWTKELANDSRAVGLFNRSGEAASVMLSWKDAGLAGRQSARDLWQRKDLGDFTESISVPVQAHGAALLTLKRSDH